MGKRVDKRKAIMGAAEALFAARRFHEITMDEIALRAGVGKGTLYRYFSSKQDLFSAVALSGYQALHDMIVAHAVPDLPFAETLPAVCRRISEFYARRRRLFQMMQVEERRLLDCRGRGWAAWAAERERLTEAVVGLLRRGVAEGRVRPDLSLDALAPLLLGMLRNQARVATGRGADSAPGGELVVEVFCRGACMNDTGERR